MISFHMVRHLTSLLVVVKKPVQMELVLCMSIALASSSLWLDSAANGLNEVLPPSTILIPSSVDIMVYYIVLLSL